MSRPARRILMGNEAIGRGIVEAGCAVAAAYPGTPSSEILEAVAAFAREEGRDLHAEWSVNEKVAFETAMAASQAGLRSAVAMKQVGLNVAADPFMRSAYLGVTGGMVVAVADDPGPHSSQTEQDSRFFARFAKLPVLDPSSPREAREMVFSAYELSERHGLPVVLRPTTRVCHARQAVECRPPIDTGRKADFRKDPRRWCATPAFIRDLHRSLNEKIAGIAREPGFRPVRTPGDGSRPRTCIVASGVAFAHAWDALEDLGLAGAVDIWQVTMPYPLSTDFIMNIKKDYDHIVIFEETYPVIELQLSHEGCRGRLSGSVPDEGELTPDVIAEVLETTLAVETRKQPLPPPGQGVRPTLCAGCGHRAAYYAIRKVFPKGIYPGDIGCYTLGVNLGAVDTCHCMGAGISQAAGFWHAYTRGGGEAPAIVATIGDSTFFHAGVPALMNAVIQGARIIVVILDNATTAMTGHQPTPASGVNARGGSCPALRLEDLVAACGVRFLRVADPYGLESFASVLREADGWRRAPEGGVAVVIARHPCVLEKAARRGQPVYDMEITDDCTGCRHCVERFECPALVWDGESKRAVIDAARCIGCGVCVGACPAGAIRGTAA